MKINLKKILIVLGILALFAASRLYIWKYWPTNYSDVRTDYERYARMWGYGLKPYTHHQYEYPPLTIPILYAPLKFESWGVNYYHNYRFEVLVVDVAFFIFFSLSINKLLKKNRDKILALLFYITITSVAKDFFYEGLDLMFTASIMTSFLLLLWLDNKKLLSKVLIWTFFWVSTAIKFLTLPLMAPLMFVVYSKFKKDLPAFIIAFLLVWGIPLLIFRSTLKVPFLINSDRPLKYSSFPSYIIQIIDSQTHSETKNSLPPDFEYYGPVSERVTQITNLVFPISMLTWLGWSLLYIAKNKHSKFNLKKILKYIELEFFKPKVLNNKNQLLLMLRIYGLYLFTLFFFAKIFSQPFHIWYMPLVAIYPFLVKKNPVLLWIAALLMVINDTTTLFYVPAGKFLNFPNYLWGYLLKFIPMGFAYFYFAKKKPSTKKMMLS